MKRIVMTLIALLTAATLFAGGKECNMKAAKTVELTGTIVQASGDEAKPVFRVANSDQSYTICEQTKSSVLKLGNNGQSLRVKAKVVNCGDGEELVISEAKKI